MKIEEQCLGIGLIGAERDVLDAARGMGLGVEFAQEEAELCGVGDVDLFVVGERVEVCEKILGVNGRGFAGGEGGVGLVVEREE